MSGSAVITFMELELVYEDNDGDGFGVNPVYICNYGQPGFAHQGGDCNDQNNMIFPGGPRECGSDGNCDGQPDYINTEYFFVDFEAGKHEFCPGDSVLITGFISVPFHSSGNDFIIQWSSTPPGLPFIQVSDSSIKVWETGVYNAVLSTTCFFPWESSTNVTKMEISLGVLVEGSPTFCQGDSVRLTFTNPDPFLELLWFPNGETGISTWAKTGGQYIAKSMFLIPSNNICTFWDTVVLSQLPAPIVEAGADFSILQGQPNQQLNPTPAGGIWTGTGVTPGGSFSCFQAPGVYTVVYQITGANGCIGYDSLKITILPPVLAKPIITPGTGTYSEPIQVSITCATPGVAIYYTTTGNTPVIGAYFTKLYTGPFWQPANGTVRAMAVLSGYSNSGVGVAYFTIANPGILTAPTISPGTGSYVGAQTVTITTNPSDASIYYTTNGNMPRFDVPNSFTFLYTGPFLMSNSGTIRALATKSGFANSPNSVAYLTIANPRVATPVISPPSGMYGGVQIISITCSTPNATILYTTNGNTPVSGTSFTKVYSGPFQLVKTATVKAIGTAPGHQNSAIGYSILTLLSPEIVVPPVFSPGAGTYSGEQTITLTTTTPGASIFYTLNGNEPRVDIPNSFTYAYTGPFSLSSSAMIRAMAIKDGLGNSPIKFAMYTIVNPKTEKPVISPSTGTYPMPLAVSISCETPGTTIYYTTNGNVPVIGSTFTKEYTGSFLVSATGTVRAVGITPGYQKSDVAVAYLTAAPVRKIAQDFGTENPEKPGIRIFPNQTNDLIHLISSVELSNGRVDVFDPLGRHVLHQEIPSGRGFVSLRNLPAGVYRIRFQSEEMTWTTTIQKTNHNKV